MLDGAFDDLAAGRGPGRCLGDLAARVNRAAFDSGIVLVELTPLRTTLEDRYLAMVAGDVMEGAAR